MATEIPMRRGVMKKNKKKKAFLIVLLILIVVFITGIFVKDLFHQPEDLPPKEQPKEQPEKEDSGTENTKEDQAEDTNKPTSNTDKTDQTTSKKDKTPPNLTLSSDEKWAKKSNIYIDASDKESGIKQIMFDKKKEKVKHNYVTVFSNGTYSVTAEDHAGNRVTKTITIKNIDTIAPRMAVLITKKEKTAIYITAQIVDNESGVAEKKWAVGKQTADYFQKKGTTFKNNQLIVRQNGTYTLYAKDEVGNESVIVFTIDQLITETTTPPPPKPIIPQTPEKEDEEELALEVESQVYQTIDQNYNDNIVTIQIKSKEGSEEKIKSITLPNGQVVSGSDASYSFVQNGTFTATQQFTLTDRLNQTHAYFVSYQVESDFDYELAATGAKITNYRGYKRDVTIPRTFGENNVPTTVIGEKAFYFKSCRHGNKEYGKIATLDYQDDECLPSGPVDALKTKAKTQVICTYEADDEGYSNYEEFVNCLIENGWFHCIDRYFSDELDEWHACIEGEKIFEKFPLTSVQLPETLITIEESAFEQNQLEYLEIPDSVTVIGKKAFALNDLSDVRLGKKIEIIEEEAFYWNRIYSVNMQNVEKLIQLGDRAFTDNNIQNITFPGSIETIGEGAFEGNELTTLYLPQHVKEVGDSSFAYNDLRELIYENEQLVMGEYAFWGNELTNVTLPKNMRVVPVGLFGYNELEEIELNEGTIEVGDEAFYYNNLKELTLPEGIEIIGDHAFDGNNLTTLVVPPTVRYLSGFGFNNINTLIIAEGVEEIGPYSFNDNLLTHLDLPTSTITINYGAFSNNKLTNLELPEGIVYLSGFSNTNLHTVTIPESVKVIGYYAFSDNYLGSTINLPSKLESISEGAFKNNNVTNIELPEGLLYLAGFENNKLTSITIPETVVEINSAAFRNNLLKEVTIPNQVVKIKDDAFYNNKLTQVNLPSSLEYIGMDAFSYNELKEITLPNNIEIIGAYAFYSNQLTKIEIPSSVRYISSGVFNRNSIKEVIVRSKTIEFDDIFFSWNSTVVLKGYKGSTLEQYANERGYVFIVL